MKHLFSKEVDKSVLYDGFAIPSSIQDIFYKETGKIIERGNKENLKIVIEDLYYEAKLTNVDFNTNIMYHTHQMLYK